MTSRHVPNKSRPLINRHQVRSGDVQHGSPTRKLLYAPARRRHDSDLFRHLSLFDYHLPAIIIITV